MGLIAASINKQQLMSYKHDLENKVMEIKQAKLELANSVKDLMNAGNDLDPESPTYKQLQARKERLDRLEKKLDLDLAEYQEKLEMVEGNLKASEEMVKSNLKEG